MSKNEFEIITHNNYHFHLFLVNLLYRTPHTHKDFEICLVLDGTFLLTTPANIFSLSKNDIFIMNPFASHELSGKKASLILSLQVSPKFFSSIYPQIDLLEFDNYIIKQSDQSNFFIRKTMLELAQTYFKNEAYSSIKCSLLINQIFLVLLESQLHHFIPESEKSSFLTKKNRIRNIMHYIDEHYMDKLLLSDIAEIENLDLYYLSHFFKETFGISFQKYLTKIRCEHARQLLLLTDYSLLDICMNCGFSAPKYFNKGFLEQYGCSPKEYRKTFNSSNLEQQQNSLLTTQEFLSPNASVASHSFLYLC